MNVFHAVSFGVFAAAALLPLDAEALAINHDRTHLAPGVCQAFVPTNQIRYNASGMTNAGTSLVYVVCSASGATDPEIEGEATLISIAVTNNGSTAKTVACTARPGSPVHLAGGQLASPYSLEAQSGQTKVLSWGPNDFGGKAVGNANFTCALYPGLTINHVRIVSRVEVGA